MQLFFHDVGLKGAERDFPKTVFGDVAVELVERSAPSHLRAEMVDTLLSLFPSGTFNCWGVPAGAKSAIEHLQVGDVMVLIRTTGGDGDMPAMCPVQAFWKEPMPSLSTALWGSDRFPYVFFCKTEPIELTWTQFKKDVDYAPNFRPSGNVYRVRQDRLRKHGGAESYVERLAGNTLKYPTGAASGSVAEVTPNIEFEEGQRLVRERSYFKRNPQLVQAAKERYKYVCQACNFRFRDKYGELGGNYIECHHLNPLSEREDEGKSSSTSLDEVTVLCSNCHRMVHRTRPAMPLERLREIIAGVGASG
ncbi:restriction endonuclease [Rubrivirga sp. SAORIC476]|nr:restriction endonuclease [Rubrivirga sp. SAORIC476]